MISSDFTAALVSDARAFVSSKFGGNDMSGVPLAAIRHAVDSLYDGGWIAYERDFARFHTTTAARTEAYSPVKQRAIVSAMTKRRLGDYDEIVNFDLQPLESAIFVVSRASVVDRRASRDIVTEREITLWKFTCTPGVGWSRDFVTITEAVHEVHTRYGVINTPVRDAEKREQFETCYRPGSERTPLQGWVARLEMSWSQAHENDMPAVPVKSTQKG